MHDSFVGYITVKTTAVAEDCVVARMAKLVEDSQNNKSRTQRFIDKCAKYYTPGEYSKQLINQSSYKLTTTIYIYIYLSCVDLHVSSMNFFCSYSSDSGLFGFSPVGI